MSPKFSIKLIAVLLASAAISLAASTAGYAHSSGGHGGSQSGGNTTAQPVHGPGSSHNPIVYHPVHGPGSSHNPILATKPVVRDHRRIYRGPYGGPYRGDNSSSEGGVTVTNSSGQVVPTRVGGTVNVVPGNGTVHDHR